MRSQAKPMFLAPLLLLFVLTGSAADTDRKTPRDRFAYLLQVCYAFSWNQTVWGFAALVERTGESHSTLRLREDNPASKPRFRSRYDPSKSVTPRSL